MIARSLLACLALLLTLPASAQIERFLEGRDYQMIGEGDSDDTVTVTEYFWYGCPSCYRLEPLLNDWRETLPEDVEFQRLPALWSEWHEIHAKAYYIAMNLGRLEELHPAVFRAMHEEGNMLRDMAALKDLFAEHGVSPERFDQAADSFQLDSQLRSAAASAEEYGLSGTPNLVVDGKYLVRGSNRMLEIASFLIEKERS